MIYSFSCPEGSLTVSPLSGAFKCVDGSGTAIQGVAVQYLPVVMTEQQATTPTENFVDGTVLGWGVAAAVMAAWAIKNLKRAL